MGDNPNRMSEMITDVFTGLISTTSPGVGFLVR